MQLNDISNDGFISWNLSENQSVTKNSLLRLVLYFKIRPMLSNLSESLYSFRNLQLQISWNVHAHFECKQYWNWFTRQILQIFSLYEIFQRCNMVMPVINPDQISSVSLKMQRVRMDDVHVKAVISMSRIKTAVKNVRKTCGLTYSR